MKDINKIKDLIVFTNGERQWQVLWNEEEDGEIKQHFIQELSTVNTSLYKNVREVVEAELGIKLPSKINLLKLVEIEKNKINAKHNPLGYVDIYLIKDYQKILEKEGK